MPRLKLTSPGALLIVATGMAGAILLLDVFFLRPYVVAQKDAALGEVAFRTVQGVHERLQSEQDRLADLARSHAESHDLPDLSDSLTAFGGGALAGEKVDLAWVRDRAGAVLSVWSSRQASLPETDPSALAEEVRRVFGGGSGPFAKGGLIRIGSRVGVYAQVSLARDSSPADEDEAAASEGEASAAGPDVPSPASTAAPPVPDSVGWAAASASSAASGTLGLARFVDDALLKRLGASVGGEVLLVGGDGFPRGALDQASASRAYWPLSDDRLAVAWLASDTEGRRLGYFRAAVPVGYIAAQAVAARRIVLIVLSLSVGLVSLVIMGTHTLVAGPVVRLLRRLQQLDSGQGSVAALTQDLHGEPLVLARKLENAFQRLAHISKTDSLTGLANRAHFQEVLDAFYHQARRYNRPLSVIVMDVDYFKAINDAAGHQAGDEVLKWVAGAIERACRKADLPARMGGDEFAVLLPETPCADAQHVAERIRQNLAEAPAAVGGMQMTLTASIGVADLNCGEIDGPQKMIVQADRALYAAKEAGRNRVMLAQDLELQGLAANNEARKVEVLYKKLAGLDNRFKDLFLHAVEEVVHLMEQRDPHMADHARKVQHYAQLLGQEMGLPSRVVQRIRLSAMMHDIGMLAMPDAVFLRPGALDDEQTKALRRHPLLSVRIMERMQFLEHEIPAVRYHHERYDGGGYPEALAGAAIPLTARILAVADAFDAMTSPRIFREARTMEDALREIREGAGKQFDPTVVDAFLALAARMGASLMELPSQEGRPAWRTDDASDLAPAGSPAGAAADPGL